MKRIVAYIVIVSVLCTMCVGAFAAEPAVTYGTSESYIVNIPEAVAIDAKTGVGTVEVGVRDAVLPEGTALVLNLHSDNAENNKWYLVNQRNGDKMEYAINTTVAGTIKPSNFLWLSAEYLTGKTLTTSCEFRLVGPCPSPGIYADCITYELSVEPVVEEINCYVCGMTFTKTEGEYCETCGTCPDCFNHAVKHCDDCGHCIAVYETHKWCSNCKTCVSPPEYCETCQKCVDCDNKHDITVKDYKK